MVEALSPLQGHFNWVSNLLLQFHWVSKYDAINGSFYIRINATTGNAVLTPQDSSEMGDAAA